MTGHRKERIGAVLKVRRLQEQQAAMELASAMSAAREADIALSSLFQTYDEGRALDDVHGSVPDVINVRTDRTLRASAIVRGKAEVRRTLDLVERRQSELVERSQAVRGLEKLDERITESHDELAKRTEASTLDELVTSRHHRGRP